MVIEGEGPHWVGRWRERAALWLNDRGKPCKASRLHARLEPPHTRGACWLVVDNGSSNGTYVNGARVSTAPLRVGDSVGFGSAVAREERQADDEIPTFHFVVVGVGEEDREGTRQVEKEGRADKGGVRDEAQGGRAAALVRAAVGAVVPAERPASAAAALGSPKGRGRPNSRAARAAEAFAQGDAEAAEAESQAEQLAGRMADGLASPVRHGEKETLLSLLAHVRRHAARARAERDIALAEGRAALGTMRTELEQLEQSMAPVRAHADDGAAQPVQLSQFVQTVTVEMRDTATEPPEVAVPPARAEMIRAADDVVAARSQVDAVAPTVPRDVAAPEAMRARGPPLFTHLAATPLLVDMEDEVVPTTGCAGTTESSDEDGDGLDESLAPGIGHHHLTRRGVQRPPGAPAAAVAWDELAPAATESHRADGGETPTTANGSASGAPCTAQASLASDMAPVKAAASSVAVAEAAAASAREAQVAAELRLAAAEAEASELRRELLELKGRSHAMNEAAAREAVAGAAEAAVAAVAQAKAEAEERLRLAQLAASEREAMLRSSASSDVHKLRTELAVAQEATAKAEERALAAEATAASALVEAREVARQAEAKAAEGLCAQLAEARQAMADAELRALATEATAASALAKANEPGSRADEADRLRAELVSAHRAVVEALSLIHI